ncbi:MAG: endo-1,4-beta-xylanase [Muribaculaceae bacterium]|nr:endo-1,4-beta-xylanase [Muribaculaceae bacterium]
MKFNKYYLGLTLLPMLASCADYLDTNNYIVEKPASIAEFEYLNDYKPLKEYIDRSAHPGFTLGTGVGVDDYLKQGSVYLLTNSNFDMMTAGNAMKYASCVADDGTMNFGKVMDFVDAAKAANMQIYGHTLCWHAQQNTKWLNSLIADKEIEMDPDAMNEVVDFELDFSSMSEYTFWHQPEAGPAEFSIEDGCLKIVNPEAVNFWEVQYFTFDNVTLEKGKEYQLTVELKATAEGAVQGNVGGWSDNASIRIPYTTDWETKTIPFTSATGETTHGLFQTGDLVGTIWYKSIKITHQEAPVSEITVWDTRDCLQVITDDMKDAAWDSQFWLVFDGVTFNAGDKWEVSMEVRANEPASIGTQVHKSAGDYLHWSAIGNVPFTKSWTTFTASGDCTAEWAGGYSIAFNLNDYAKANEYYFDNISFKLNGQELVKNSACDQGGSTECYVSKECRGELMPTRIVDGCFTVIKSNMQPLTPDEKKEVLTAEMERWVKGMMDATGGYVKAWDVVNEAISGGPWGQRYDLQHAGDNPNDFFWQDYLGDDFVRVPVKFARQYFAENGGNPDELKLFVNDYNLESDWDDNQKLKSLIEWIKQWESDGETVIDGIGSQMHISYYMNPQTQKSKEDHIVKMLELMAASGKLCRITELDMGLVDENGNSVKSEDVTVEQHKLMGEHYKWIVKKYFEIIPQAQQFGICQWCQTDAPESSGWRGGEPVGLWNLNLQRKPAYGGMADGLEGK